MPLLILLIPAAYSYWLLNHIGCARAARTLVVPLRRITPPPPCNVAASAVVAQADGGTPLSEKPPNPQRACLSAVRGPDPDPGVPDLLIMHLRIVDHHIQSQVLHRQSADCRQQ